MMLTQEQLIETAAHMVQNGNTGSFINHLGRLWQLGDCENRVSLYKTFNDTFNSYYQITFGKAGSEKLPDLSNLSLPLALFARDMQYKLNKNRNKPCRDMQMSVGEERRWDNCTLRWLLKRIREEVDELEGALQNGEIDEARYECADVANFAMMVHDNLSRLPDEQIEEQMAILMPGDEVIVDWENPDDKVRGTLLDSSYAGEAVFVRHIEPGTVGEKLLKGGSHVVVKTKSTDSGSTFPLASVKRSFK